MVKLVAHGSTHIGEMRVEIDLEVGTGEVVGVVGPNGAGKTSWLRCIAGFIGLEAGSIFCDGSAWDEPAASLWTSPENRGIGMVFQQPALFDHLSVRENIAFPMRARGMPSSQIVERVEEHLHRFNLERYAESRPSQLSGGEQQKVAVARAIVGDPAVLLLDEPFSGIDVETRKTIRADLAVFLSSFKGACVLVSHDGNDVDALATSRIEIDRGQMRQ
jgi:molybdate transport system ATP-binding protein